MSVFETLNAINVNDKTEKKNGLTFLAWAFAWGEVKKIYPDSTYTIYETTNPQGYVCNYFTDGRTCWVKTGVTIEGLEHIEELPVMDYRNNSIPLEKVTSFDVNKAIQRSLTKAVARHGLGLYIYAGEDLPDGEEEAKVDQKIISVIVETATRYAKMKNGDPDELLKYYLNKYKVQSIEDLTYKNGIAISRELSKLIERRAKQ